MINIYELLGVCSTATEQDIQRAISRHELHKTLSPEILNKARQWLLISDTRKQYNAKLYAEHPEILEALIAQHSSASSATAHNQSDSIYIEKSIVALKSKAKIISAVLIGLIIAFTGYIYYSPYLVLNKIHSAIKSNQPEKISEHIDYPALQTSLKAQLKIFFQKKLDEDPSMKSNPFSGFAQMLGNQMINELTETIVSPQGLKAIVTGENPVESKRNPATENTESNEKEVIEPNLQYEDYNTFIISYPLKNGTKEMKFIMKRDGLTKWVVRDISFPDLSEL